MDIPLLASQLESLCCRSEMTLFSDSMKCARCGSWVPIKNDSVVFSDLGCDVVPKQKKNPEDRNTWTDWRKLNYDYIEEKLSDLPPGAIVLDLGAGPSQFRSLLEKHKTIATDFYPYKGIDVVCNICEVTPFKDCIADCIIVSNVLEHMYDPMETLKECFRLLRPGGRLILTVPFLIRVHQAPYDYYRYTHFALEHLFVNAGFSQNKVESMGNIFDVNLVFYKSLLKRMEKGESGIRKFVFRVLRKVDYAIFRRKVALLKKWKGSYHELSSPQGYGVVAIRKCS